MRKLWSNWVRFYWPAIGVMSLQVGLSASQHWHTPLWALMVWGSLDVLILVLNTFSRKCTRNFEQHIAQLREEIDRRRNGL